MLYLKHVKRACMSEKTVPVQFIVPSLFLVRRLKHLHVLVHFPVPGENSPKKQHGRFPTFRKNKTARINQNTRRNSAQT